MTNTQIRVAQAGAAPSGVVAAAVGTGGTFAAGAQFWKITRRTLFGETQPSTEVTATLVLNGSASLTWSAAPGTYAFRIYRGTVTNTENLLVAEVDGHATSFVDTGASVVAATPPAAPAAFANANLSSTALALKTSGALSGLNGGQLAQALRAINYWHNFPTDPANTVQAAKILAAVGIAIQEV